MKKSVSKVPREKRTGTYLSPASRLDEKVRKAGHKEKKKTRKSEK